MKEKKPLFKNMSLRVAFATSVFFGASSIFLVSKTLPITLDVADLIDKGTSIDAVGSFVIVVVTAIGLITYSLTLAFLLAQKRLVEILYEEF